MCQRRTFDELLFNLMNLLAKVKVERTIFVAIRFYNFQRTLSMYYFMPRLKLSVSIAIVIVVRSRDSTNCQLNIFCGQPLKTFFYALRRYSSSVPVSSKMSVTMLAILFNLAVLCEIFRIKKLKNEDLMTTDIKKDIYSRMSL